ncbi:hypothetical protein CERSUDRAFT_93046 [Gelatoporia subvermispora B]|uniref:Uncharacterized protein n=1 Tax=Ceriporiopsis subvermispora (strain B) TaxID=914234 RepID=M2RJN8_CERS8|nr:hypothetical protein CERSUDRAFT_93046 [Gelatoporia subvermispora B]
MVQAYDVFVTQYCRGVSVDGRPLEMNWRLCIRMGQSQEVAIGRTYEFVGSPGRFALQVQDSSPYAACHLWRGSLHVGSIPADRLAAVDEIIEGIMTRQDGIKAQWVLHHWIFAVVGKLHLNGYRIMQVISLAELEDKMRLVFKDWEKGYR